ncbi:MAG: alkaline phosphatase D family protein [Vicinamibacterales bacterium]
MTLDRRRFLLGTLGATILGRASAELFASTGVPAVQGAWDAGQVRHLLPTVSETDILLKASFSRALRGAPSLRVGARAFRGQVNDTAGEFWQFRAEGLAPGATHRLDLRDADGRPLCEPWEIRTFPGADATPERFRILFFTCAGGHEALQFLPGATRSRMLRRALSFGPDAVVANGDHVYWDQLSPTGGPGMGASAQARELAGTFQRSALVFGTTNETVLKRAAGPQIVPVYGTDFRSTPVFFLQDDHDYFENDEGTDQLVTFPPSTFMLRLARATQKLYYPEFLPHASRPAGLPWSASEDRDRGLSESFGTLRIGRLVEVLLYDVRRTMTLAGSTGVFLDPEAERWLRDRTASTDTAHLVHAPSSPPGWSAGKWGEWYPDILSQEGRLTTSIEKPYWQPGWLAQHDRLMTALAANRARQPLVVSGDLHALAVGRMLRSGRQDFSSNPITTILSGPVGTRPGGWPSARRGIGATPSSVVDLQEPLAPIEQHGFTIADFTPDAIELRLFKWDVGHDRMEALDTLQPFHTTRLPRPS